MLHIQFCRRVVDRAIPVVVVAHRAVQHMVLQNAVERLALRDVDGLARGLHLHPSGHPGPARAHQFAVHLHHAGIAALDRPHLWDIADLGNGLLCLHRCPSVQQINQQFA